MPAADDVPTHALHIVTGKGGSGKTTIAAALAMALATKGRRVLICEVEGRQGLAGLFDTPPNEGGIERKLATSPAGGEVFGLSIDARDALMEYLATFYRLGVAGRALDKLGLYDFATSIAPGLRDVLLTGKVYEAVRRRMKSQPNSYDAVVLDAPPTGRITPFLGVHEAVAGLAKIGPIHSQAASITKLFRSAATTVHIVTLLQEMPVTETLEAIEALKPTGIRPGSIICNQASPTPLSAEQLDLVEQPDWTLRAPGLSAEQARVLRDEFADGIAELQAEQACYEQLIAADLPLIEVPFDPDGIDVAALADIAQTLGAQLKEEVHA